MAALALSVPFLTGGACWEADCHPNCGCLMYDFPTSGVVTFERDVADVTLRPDTVSFLLRLAPVEVAIENQQGRISAYDTVSPPSWDISTVTLHLIGGTWPGSELEATRIGRERGQFVLAERSLAGWWTITGVSVRTMVGSCPMGEDYRSGSVPVSSDSLLVVNRQP